MDLEAAAEHDIAVCNIRDYCTASVVEHVFSVVLQLARSTTAYRADMSNGAWQKADNFCLLNHPVRELAAMKIGIVGFGNLGRGVAKVAEAFGMEVLVARRPGTDTGDDDERIAFDELLATVDVLTLHCPLTDDTRGLIGAAELARMKSSAILVNTARGGLVDSAALAAALGTGQLGGAAIDVLPVEPPSEGNPLLDYRGDNLILTPHIAWATIEARQNAVNELAVNVSDFLRGGHRNRVA